MPRHTPLQPKKFPSFWTATFLRSAIVPFAAAALIVPSMAQAQAVDGYKFLDAVKKRDGDKATEMIEGPGSTVINTRDLSTGQSALHIVTGRRDLTWMGFVLGKGARVDAVDNQGVTPLIIAAQLGFLDGATLLLNRGADINKGDSQGVTPLIRAVLNRDLPMVRLLVARGANPDKTDSVTGLSARDQAARDPRATTILNALTAKKPASDRPVMGPVIK